MNQDTPLPIAVQNLRRIWEAKKIEMQFNQTGAAKELGWTQSAISHYLNNITEMGTGAIVKLANFLDVDPTEIDPSIVSKLPNVHKIPLTKGSDDLTRPVNRLAYGRDDIPFIWVHVDSDIPIEGTSVIIYGDDIDNTPGMSAALKLCKQSHFTSNKLVAVRLKSEKHLRVYRKSHSPKPSQIHTLWAVMAILYI